ncbi:MAG TPA: tyrosine-type recombinase/integrase [Dictyobacter sp.]|jgi:site-specific recombinase XerD|nr:tyrosine-type recombinase/integrase [Dictyobacter sp.]
MQNDSEQEKYIRAVEVDEGSVVQSDLFGTAKVATEVVNPPETLHSSLSDLSSLAECVQPYKQELIARGKSTYTVTCFLSDLKMFMEFLGPDTPVGRITKEQITDWLMKLKFGQGQTPAPKTMARRVTFLKNLFSWLEHEQLIHSNPAAGLALERPLPPLPELLSDEEVQSLLQAAADDPRCYCLVYLVLRGGLKKEEVMRLNVHHIDTTDEKTPLVTVRFEESAGKQHRERRVAMPPEFTGIFNSYLEIYRIQDKMFPCTDRNLNYILARAVKTSAVQKRVTLQILRDTFAVQQLRAGTSFDALREKMGLSDEAWLESKEKYRRLAFTNANEDTK